jgi:hypothetical protein
VEGAELDPERTELRSTAFVTLISDSRTSNTRSRVTRSRSATLVMGPISPSVGKPGSSTGHVLHRDLGRETIRGDTHQTTTVPTGAGQGRDRVKPFHDCVAGLAWAGSGRQRGVSALKSAMKGQRPRQSPGESPHRLRASERVAGAGNRRTSIV